MAGVVRRIANGGRTPSDAVDASLAVVLLGQKGSKAFNKSSDWQTKRDRYH
jgi:hypothetical protein